MRLLPTAARRAFFVLLGAMVALDLLALTLRVIDVASYGRLVLLPAEGPVLYAIWRLRHGQALYLSPLTPPFTATIYNFLFYRSYAALLQVAGVADAAAPVAGRFITIAWSLAGAAFQYGASRRLYRDARPAPALLAGMAILTWFGAAFPGWWALAIRPDVPAVACAAAGVWAFAAALGGGRRRWLIVASCAFFAEWCFKQSQIGIFVAACAYLIIWRRSLADLACLTVPAALGWIVAFAVGGATYVMNVLRAPSMNPFDPFLPVYWYRLVAVVDLLPWALAVWALAALVRSLIAPGRAARWQSSDASVRLLGVDVSFAAVATLVTFASATVVLARIGAALNHALEFHLAASLLATGVLAGAARLESRRVHAAAAATLVPMLTFAVLLLGGREQGRVATLLQLKVWGEPLHLARGVELAERRELAARVRALPAPIYWEDETLVLPWDTFAEHPNIVVDPLTYDNLARRGLLETRLEDLFRSKYIGAAVLKDSSPYAAVAVRAGYRVAGTLPQHGGEPLRILVRPR